MESLAFHFSQGEAVSTVTPSQVNSESLIFRVYFFSHDFLIVTDICWSIAFSKQSDPTWHVYPSCFSHMISHLAPKIVSRYHSFCYTAGYLSNPLQGQVFGSMTSHIPGIPTTSPSHLASTLSMAIQLFLSCKKDICKIRERRSFPWDVDLSQTYSVSCENVSFQHYGCQWSFLGTLLWLSLLPLFIWTSAS